MFKAFLRRNRLMLPLGSALIIAACSGKDSTKDSGDGDGDEMTSSGGMDGEGAAPGSGGGDPGTGGRDAGTGGDSPVPPTCALPEIEESGRCRAARVYVLSDFLEAKANEQNSVSRFLVAAGFDVATGPHFSAWQGAPAALAGVDVVLLLGGKDYDYALTSRAQDTLTSFVADGGGLIFTEWSGYQEDDELTLGLLPIVYDGGYEEDNGATWIVDDPSHPLAADLPLGMGGAGGAGPYHSEAGWSYVKPLGGATVVVSNTEGYPVATYLTCHGGTTIHLNHDVHYARDPVDDGDLILFRNAVYFAALDVPSTECQGAGGAGGAGEP